MKRRTTEIRCIDCGMKEARERTNDGVIELHCEACGSTFGWDNLPKECRNCKRRIWSWGERSDGTCSPCEVASWTPEKREAIGKMIGMAIREPDATEEQKDAAIDEAFKHL